MNIGVTISQRAMVKLLSYTAISVRLPARACLTKLGMFIVPTIDSPNVDLEKTGDLFVGEAE
jgi:hypothetical protein